MTVFSHFFWNWYLFRRRSWAWKFAWGGVLPDLPYTLLLGYYSLRFGVNGLFDLPSWDLAWRNPLTAALHSFVPCLAAGAALALARWPARAAWAPVWSGWLSHVVVDMLTHRTDGYPIFYPLSDYRFPTPISYWEPEYHGREFMLINGVLIALLLGRHFVRRRMRRPALEPRQSPISRLGSGVSGGWLIQR